MLYHTQKGQIYKPIDYFFIHDLIYHRILTRVTRCVPLVEQELLTFRDHMVSELDVVLSFNLII